MRRRLLLTIKAPADTHHNLLQTHIKVPLDYLIEYKTYWEKNSPFIVLFYHIQVVILKCKLNVQTYFKRKH